MQVGDTADVSLDQLMLDPHPIHHRLRAGGPIVWVASLGGWLVLNRAEAVAVMRNPDLFTVDDPRFSTARVVGRSMLSTDGEEHTRLRAPFSRQFNHAQAKELGPFIKAKAESLVESFPRNRPVDLRTEFAGPIAVSTITSALGLPSADDARVLAWYRKIVAAVERIGAGLDPGTEGDLAAGELANAVGVGLDRSGTGLSRKEFASGIAVVMFGAIETSEGATTNALWHLLTNPSELKLLRSNPGLIGNALEESLRLEPAAASVDRYAKSDIGIAGVAIKAGDYVSVSLAAANRDPSVFESPDSFKITRSNAADHVAFAQGPHACLGIHLAKSELQIAVATVLAKLPRLRLSNDKQLGPYGLIFRKPEALLIEVR